MREADVRKILMFMEEGILLHKRRTPPLNENKDPLRKMNKCLCTKVHFVGSPCWFPMISGIKHCTIWMPQEEEKETKRSLAMPSLFLRILLLFDQFLNLFL